MPFTVYNKNIGLSYHCVASHLDGHDYHCCYQGREDKDKDVGSKDKNKYEDL